MTWSTTGDEIDWDNLLNFDNGAENFDFFFDATDTAAEDTAAIEVDSWMGELEELLMKDDEVLVDTDGGVINTNGDVINTNSDVSNANTISAGFLQEFDLVVDAIEPEVKQSSPSSENSPNFEVEKSSDDAVEVNNDDDNDDDDNDDNDDDPLAKKRKRQMRNRDAAMRSRERKKIRVKELEMKSRYFEEECRRLQRLLHCCYAENHWLRCSLQTYGAPITKPESAVLLLESLLLGSLVWLMVNICLLLPQLKLPLLNQDAAARVSADRKLLETAAQRGKGTKTSELWITLSFTRSKRCRASRTKMKSRSTISCF